VTLGIQHAMRIRYIVICDHPSYTVFFSHYPINGMVFGEKKVTEHKMRFLNFLQICL